MGGVELAEKFTAEFPRIPVLFMSGYTDQIMRHWNSLGAYIQKPFTLSDLLTQVRELLDRAVPDSMRAEDLPAAG
jgi:FixJ family two-component response regulator